MLPGEFERKLKACNRLLKIIPPPDLHTRPSGLYFAGGHELQHICGVDNLEVPEREYVDEVGHIIKRGWRKAVQILIHMKFIDQRKAEKVFETKFGMHLLQPAILVVKNKKVDLMNEVTKQSAENSSLYGNPRGNIVLKKDQLMDFAHEMKKESGISEAEDEAQRREILGS